MSETEKNSDVYDLIAEFARSSNPTISEKEILEEFVNPFHQHENEVNLESNKINDIKLEAIPSTNKEDHDRYDELNLKFDLLSEQFRDAQKQISKIKQIFSLNEPVVETPPASQEYYHKEFQALSAKLNEVFVTNYKQIETKFEVLQAEMALGRSKGDSLTLDQNKIMNSFKIQFTQIQLLKEKLEGVKEIFIEKTGTLENTITKEDLKTEFANFTSSHIQQFNEQVLKNENANRANLAYSPTPETVPAHKNSFPNWLVWLNVFILGLMSMYLLNQIFIKGGQNSNLLPEQIESTNSDLEENQNSPLSDIEEQLPTTDSGFIQPIVLQRIDSMNNIQQSTTQIKKASPTLSKLNNVSTSQTLKPIVAKKLFSEEVISNELSATTNTSETNTSNASILESKIKDTNKATSNTDNNKESVTFGID